MQKKYLLLFVYFAFFVGLVTYEILNPPFSSDEAKVGNYDVQITTTPSVPGVGTVTKVHFKVLDQNNNIADNVRMGVKVYHDDVLTREFAPTNYPGEWDMDYVFHMPGNHVFEVALYDPATGNTDTYDFNITTLSLYTSIFMVLVILGVGGAAGMVIVIFLITKKTRPNFRY